jgi:hypothetical protein
MAFKDPQRRQNYHREYARMRRGNRVCQTQNQTLRQTPATSEYHIRTAKQVLLLLEEQILQVRGCEDAGPLEKARTIGFLAGVALRAVEAADLAARVEAIEQSLQTRKEDVSWAESVKNTTSGESKNVFR